MSKKIRVGIIFGGRSGEHEVSLRSARSVVQAIDREKYEVVPVGISKEGHWLIGGDPIGALQARVDPRLLKAPAPGERSAASQEQALAAVADEEAALVPRAALLDDLDVVFPVLHGPYGEDGTVQGLLELAGLPYVGAGVTGSALAMDKILFKDVMLAHGLPIVPDLRFKRKRWDAEREAVLDEVETTLEFPVFVKPANLGSSVGITKCHDRATLVAGLDEAARFDRKLLVELAVPHAREIEVSVLGNDEPIASLPGEIVPSREFYDYAAKYIDEGEDASDLLIPAPLPDELTRQVRALAVQTYLAIDCAGLARVDFLLNGESGELFVNEVNTIPGFTSISMYPKLWEATGIPYSELISRLIDLALERHADRQRSATHFDLRSEASPKSKASSDAGAGPQAPFAHLHSSPQVQVSEDAHSTAPNGEEA
jgi:D-alanine-D-alanine ligase